MAEVDVEKVKLVNFADFFLNFPEDDTEKIIADIEETGGSVADNQDRILNFLKQKRAELRLQTGRRFKEEYLKLRSENTIKDSEDAFSHSGLALAYRNKSGNSEKDDDKDSAKMDLIKKAKEKSKE
jgi:hypothetical protein